MPSVVYGQEDIFVSFVQILRFLPPPSQPNTMEVNGDLSPRTLKIIPLKFSFSVSSRNNVWFLCVHRPLQKKQDILWSKEFDHCFFVLFSFVVVFLTLNSQFVGCRLQMLTVSQLAALALRVCGSNLIRSDLTVHQEPKSLVFSLSSYFLLMFAKWNPINHQNKCKFLFFFFFYLFSSEIFTTEGITQHFRKYVFFVQIGVKNSGWLFHRSTKTGS